MRNLGSEAMENCPWLERGGWQRKVAPGLNGDSRRLVATESCPFFGWCRSRPQTVFIGDAPDPRDANYGDVPLEDLQSKAVSVRKWIEIANLNDQNVPIRGRAHAIRSVSKKMAFLVVRERGFTVQCVLSLAPDVVEIQLKKLYCISKAVPALPINIEDAARGEIEIEKALQLMALLGFIPQSYIGGSSPVFRAEDSYTHKHLCEFTGLDVEMEIKEHYSEVMDIVDRLFVAMFDSLNEKCQKELEAIGKQYPFEPLKYLRMTLRLTFQEGVQMLKVTPLPLPLSLMFCRNSLPTGSAKCRPAIFPRPMASPMAGDYMLLPVAIPFSRWCPPMTKEAVLRLWRLQRSKERKTEAAYAWRCISERDPSTHCIRLPSRGGLLFFLA
ncbi:hypothetical protein HYC85_016866 [Camellia sinensis]|uniref:Aminoacyl-tRNA synthetase class II (D/K/N) domain-containing protein n=1 Tax=Camellia sinensis TaxID=4442 RepID=A0A7J7H4I9_CAMSI|nr:hypothetical protein HYC85_016866 [Camellia sinensis]